MNKRLYNKTLFVFLVISDILASYVALWIIFNNYYIINLGFAPKTNFLLTVTLIQLFWMPIFYLANLYDTRATLSRFEEIEEFNIGHYLIGESVFFGLSKVIKKFKKIIK